MVTICNLLLALLLASFSTTHGWYINQDGKARSKSSQYSAHVIFGMPWVESYGHQRLRLLWESKPFELVSEIMEAVIVKKAPRPLLHFGGCSEMVFDTMFAPLFSSEPHTLDIPPPERQQTKTSFALKVAYRGTDFCGWQTQLNNDILPSVQKSLEDHLALLEGSRVDVRVSGRTDAGVSAIGQVCRFRSRNIISKDALMDHMESFPMSRSLRCLEAKSVSESFHPTFGTKFRAYVYMIDDMSIPDLEIERLDNMLRLLESETLDYVGVSYGKVTTSSTYCTLRCARAFPVISSERRSICIQLIGDRFLRRMVRLLVATALSLSLERKDCSALLDLVRQQDRTLASKAAPPDGLIFIGADFDSTVRQ